MPAKQANPLGLKPTEDAISVSLSSVFRGIFLVDFGSEFGECSGTGGVQGLNVVEPPLAGVEGCEKDRACFCARTAAAFEGNSTSTSNGVSS